jgi:hypothetical protein
VGFNEVRLGFVRLWCVIIAQHRRGGVRLVGVEFGEVKFGNLRLVWGWVGCQGGKPTGIGVCPGEWTGGDLGIGCGWPRGDRGVQDRPRWGNPHVGRADRWGLVPFWGRAAQNDGEFLVGRGVTGMRRSERGGYDLWEATHSWGGAHLKVRLFYVMVCSVTKC